MPLPAENRAPAPLASTALLRERAFTTLHHAIRDAVLQPGDDLREDDLIEWLGMTRQPIRAALLRLESFGLVEIVPGRPARVAVPDPLRTGRTLMLSGILNSFAILRSYRSLSAEQLIEIDDATAATEAARSRHDMQAMPEAVARFFDVFIAATGNAVLDSLGFELMQLEWPKVSPEYAKRIADRVTRVNRAAQARDEDDMPAAVRHLYDYVYADFMTTYRQV